MTATRKILLLVLCTTASAALAAQEAKDDASKSGEEKAKTEQKNPGSAVQPGQIPMITFPGVGIAKRERPSSLLQRGLC